MPHSNIYEEIEQRNIALSKVRPFTEFQLQQIKDFFRSETTWSSNALEGNTLDLNETDILLKDGITVRGHSIREIHECLGHARAYDFMFSLHEKHNISENDIKQLHALFAQYIDNIRPGTYRNENVIITGSKYPLPPHEKVLELMAEFVSWMDTNRKKMNPIIFAAESHRRFVYIHPFLDGNGRVSRLLMNSILLQESYLPVSIPPIRKRDYCMALENGRKFPNKFNNFIAEMELMTLTDYMRMLNIGFSKSTQKTISSDDKITEETGKMLIKHLIKSVNNNRTTLGIKKSIDTACKEIIGTDKTMAAVRKKMIEQYIHQKEHKSINILEYIERQSDVISKNKIASKKVKTERER